MKQIAFTIALIVYALILTHRQIEAQTPFVLRGIVTDSSTAEPLAAANVRVLGTSRGTITNTRGEFVLPLDSLPHMVVVSYLAYKAETLAVEPRVNAMFTVRLKPAPIQLQEVVISGEDPAVEIIRQAIAHKREWMSKLAAYQFKAFTRQVLWRDTEIASITEAYSEGYQKTGDSLREVVKQRRQTQNVPNAENFTAVRRIVNFNEDRVDLFSIRVNQNSSAYTFVGPTAIDALDNYDYRLLKTSQADGHEIYHIHMTPKSRLKPLFDGEILIADETFAVMGVDVKPNESFTVPFIKNIDLRYRQEFALYDTIFWMPTDVRIDGGFSVSIVGLSLPRIGIDVVSSIYDYAVNPAIPDSMLTKPRLTIDSSATKYDSTFWASNQVLPLTHEEAIAYRSLDSTQTLEKQFEPKGPLAALGDRGTESVLGILDARFDRVEGFFLGAKKDFTKLSPYLKLDAAVGIGFSDKRFKYLFGATGFPFKQQSLGIGGEIYTKLDNVPDEGFYGPFAISLMALIDRNDYRDYYLAKGGRAFISSKPTRGVEATLSFLAEQHYSLDLTTDYSIFSRTSAYRPNPPIADGKLRSFRLDVRLGDEDVPLDIVARDALEISVEHSSPSIASSEFDFTRYNGTLSWHVATFARDLLFPPSIRFRLSGGFGASSLPPQRLFTLDTRASGYAPFGVLHGGRAKEFAGDRFVMLNVEHNFRSVPFLLLDIPFLYRNSIELIVHGSIAQTWNGSISTSDGWYSEAGIGFSRILDLLRMDLTYRFKEPKRFFFTVSIATLF